MADILNVNPTPKERFIAYKPFVDGHRELIGRPELQRGFDFALLEFQRELAAGITDGNGAAANHYKLAGAHEFIRVFRKLAEQTVIPRKPAGEREITME